MALETINVDSIEYNVTDLKPTEIEILTLYEAWSGDATIAKRDMLKNQAAMRDVANELIRKVREYEGHAEKVAQAAADSATATAPADGGPATAPADGGPTTAPVDGGPTTAPVDGGPTTAPAITETNSVLNPV